MARLGDVCEVRAGATHHEIVSDTGKYPVYGSGGYICQATTYRCPANTVTIGRKGTLDKPLLIEEPFWNIDTCFGVIPNEALDAKYLWRFCQNFDFYKLIPAIGRPSTNSDAIKSITIPLPPLSVQRAIVARLEKELGEADKLAAKFKRVAELADDAFKAELDETFKALEDNSRRDAETRRVRLGDVCEIKNGYTPKKDGLSEEGDIPYFRISSMNFPENLKMLDSPNAWLRGHWRSFKKGSIVFPKNGGAAYTGKVRVLSQDSVVDLNTGVCTPNSDCAKDYLYFWFTQIDIKRAIVEGTIPFVDLGKLADFLIPLPHLAAQRAIVAKLDAAKERCEKLKAAAMRGLAAAENLRKAILAEAFEQ